MRINRTLFVALFILLAMPPLYAQEKQSGQSQDCQPAGPQIPLKVQFLVTEYDGAKKVASMPYATTVVTSHVGRRDSTGSLRVGVRVPVTVTKKGNDQEAEYIDVGTAIGYWVELMADGRYLASGWFERSSLFAKDAGNEPKEWTSSDVPPGGNPLLRQTRADFSVALHEGQVGEALSVTDPMTARVFKLEVAVSASK